MKKVLIITYYWPPAGGPGVQRWLNFVKYLRDNNIQPYVYIPENATYPITDESLMLQVPEDAIIIKKPIREPYKWASLFSSGKTKQISSGLITKSKQSFLEKTMLWVRGNIFIPDARKYWIKPSVRFLKEYILKENISTVITTGPPHSMHLIGNNLKRQRDIKWIADFRDPWTQIGYHKELKLTKWASEKHIRLEKRILNEADTVIVTSFTTADEFKAKTDRSIEVITNGFDNFQGTRPKPGNSFSLAHMGSLLSKRNPVILWKALSELVSEDNQLAKDLKLELTGTISNDVVLSIKNHGLTPFLKINDYKPHDLIREMQCAAQILLLIEIDSEETRGIIPGKLFEYMSAERPILAIGPERWDVEKIIKQTNTGAVFTYDDKYLIKEFIKEAYNDFKNSSLKVNGIGIQQYSRKSLTSKLARLIHSL